MATLKTKYTSLPILRYKNASDAITWLCEAFGFSVFLKVPGEGQNIEHARLTLDNNMIMLASLGRPGKFEQRFKSPSTVSGVTQSTFIFTPDPSPIYQSAKQAGANIIDELSDFEFGGRSFSCEDLESHLWVFSSYDPWTKPE